MKTKQLQTGWKEFELKDLGKLIMGQSPKGENYNNEQRGFPLLNGAADFKYKKIMPKQFTTKPTKLSKKGDLVFCIRATIGKTTLSDKEYCLGRGVAGFRVNNKLIERDFLLKILDDKLNRIVLQGSTILGIKAKDIESIKILLPPLSTQKQIVDILERAEQLKEKRKQTIEFLDDYLKSVFNEMFWKKKFEEIEIKQGILKTENKIPEKEFPEEYFEYVDIASVDNKYKTIVGTKKIIGKEAPSRAKQLIKFKDVLVSTVRPNLNAVALVPKYLDNQICSTGYCILRADNKKFIPEYLFFISKLPFFINELVGKTKGANYPAVSDRDIKGLKIPLPSLSLQQKFASIVDHVEKLKEKQKQSLEEIEKLSGALTQKAFRGDLI